jgi:DNA-binding transcriptional regulator/RsmH inhibitor MraZ
MSHIHSKTNNNLIYTYEGRKNIISHSNVPEIDNFEKKYKGKPRTIKPQRDQVEMMMFSIDQLIPSDHKARLVWKYVENLIFQSFY